MNVIIYIHKSSGPCDKTPKRFVFWSRTVEWKTPQSIHYGKDIVQGMEKQKRLEYCQWVLSFLKPLDKSAVEHLWVSVDSTPACTKHNLQWVSKNRKYSFSL